MIYFDATGAASLTIFSVNRDNLRAPFAEENADYHDYHDLISLDATRTSLTNLQRKS